MCTVIAAIFSRRSSRFSEKTFDTLSRRLGYSYGSGYCLITIKFKSRSKYGCIVPIHSRRIQTDTSERDPSQRIGQTWKCGLKKKASSTRIFATYGGQNPI